MHCYTIYYEKWPKDPSDFVRIINIIADILKIQSFQIRYLEIYDKPTKYHKDQVLTKKDLQELIYSIWENKYWAYVVAHKLYFCIHEDNIRIGCPLAKRKVENIAKQYGLYVTCDKFRGDTIKSKMLIYSFATPRKIKMKKEHYPPLDGYDATPILLPKNKLKEYRLDKSPFGLVDDWNWYSDIGNTFNGVVLTEEMYFATIKKMVQCIREITDQLALDKFRLIFYRALGDSELPSNNSKNLTKDEMLDIIRLGLREQSEFLIRSKRFILYSTLDFGLVINATLPYDTMDMIAKNNGVFSTVLWKEVPLKHKVKFL